jgi:hypothetical protein
MRFDTAIAARYDAPMARSFYYLVDGLTTERGERLKRALEQVPSVTGVIIRPTHGTVEVQSNRDPEDNVKMACAIAGTVFRVKINKRSLM